jgi:hypothetical protein
MPFIEDERHRFAFAFERLDRNTFLPAMIASYFGRREPLIPELRNLLIEIDQRCRNF